MVFFAISVAVDALFSLFPKGNRTALVIVDVQNDFITGSLAVEGAANIVPVINWVRATNKYDLIVVTQDMHPANHISFHENRIANKHKFSSDVAGMAVFDNATLLDGSVQTLWPAHCVKGTQGAEVHRDLTRSSTDAIVLKGQNSNIDSYSAFYDNNSEESTGLTDLLRRHNIANVHCCGLAFDVCVGFTAIDGANDGFNVAVIADACRSVTEEGRKKMVKNLADHNIALIQSNEVATHL